MLCHASALGLWGFGLRVRKARMRRSVQSKASFSCAATLKSCRFETSKLIMSLACKGLRVELIELMHEKSCSKRGFAGT